MSGLTIVAVPSRNDKVWQASSEKVPHMTLLFLGEVPDEDAIQITNFVGHVARVAAQPFDMEVSRRDTLGPKEADVLIFKKSFWSMRTIGQFRSDLLGNPLIQKYYNSTEQYPEWTPHLTMGYPETPAKKPTDGSNDSYWFVNFDKIEVWTGDYEGAEFTLDDNSGMEVAEVFMSSNAPDFLAHYGVKGMRWGIRKDGSGQSAGEALKGHWKRLRTIPDPEAVTVISKRGKKVKATGGRFQEAHPDAIKVKTSRQIAKSSSTDALSTRDLQEAVNRMNLEQQYSRLATTDRSFAQRFIQAQVKSYSQDPVKYTKNVNDKIETGKKVVSAARAVSKAK